ncbi:MAG: hypothetical protein AUG04_05705 [Deltaproteobacteria bacterium 13_1_20CM_2_69_21]|nr:MAG: hypothetical protein AUG04_05705 [Deltaproteobacteria bacterium 13_1_20CM_2_69_21]
MPSSQPVKRYPRSWSSAMPRDPRHPLAHCAVRMRVSRSIAIVTPFHRCVYATLRPGSITSDSGPPATGIVATCFREGGPWRGAEKISICSAPGSVTQASLLGDAYRT